MKSLKERIEEVVEKYKCKCPNIESYGCTDCLNQGYIFDNEEIGLIVELDKEVDRLKDIAKSYQLSFRTEKRIFDNTLTELKEENKRLHSYNEQRWNL